MSIAAELTLGCLRKRQIQPTYSVLGQSNHELPRQKGAENHNIESSAQVSFSRRARCRGCNVNWGSIFQPTGLMFSQPEPRLFATKGGAQWKSAEADRETKAELGRRIFAALMSYQLDLKSVEYTMKTYISNQ